MHYLIDGYNLLFKITTAKRSLEEKRKQLIADLNEIITELKLYATIVFDGALTYPEYAIRQHFRELEIVYTPEGQTADAYIIQEVERSERPDQILVITSDRSLALHCKNFGAHSKSIHNFLADLTKKKNKKKQQPLPQAAFRDSEANLARYLLIFEKKLLEEIQKEIKETGSQKNRKKSE